jgi:hypothetical protein
VPATALRLFAVELQPQARRLFRLAALVDAIDHDALGPQRLVGVLPLAHAGLGGGARFEQLRQQHLVATRAHVGLRAIEQGQCLDGLAGGRSAAAMLTRILAWLSPRRVNTARRAAG